MKTDEFSVGCILEDHILDHTVNDPSNYPFSHVQWKHEKQRFFFF